MGKHLKLRRGCASVADFVALKESMANQKNDVVNPSSFLIELFKPTFLSSNGSNMNIEPIIRYILVTSLVIYLAFRAWKGVAKVKENVTG